MRDFYSKGRSTVFAENGMCATSHPIAAQAAVDVLKDGGNAMDAAIAGAVLLGICEPQMTGIGGDCFVLFSPAGRDDVLAMNGSGRAPANLTADKLREAGHDKVPLRDPSAVTIPTAIDAFCTLSEDWGKLGLDRILQPAIQYARNGVAVAPRVGYDWSNLLDTFHETAIPFFTNNGSAPATGTRFSYPGQAEVIEKIAAQGRDGFYSGDVCADMVETLRSLGGQHTEDEFADARAEYTNPISGSYGKYELIEHPPNGQGATAILMANMLKNFDIASLDPYGVERAHIEAEISKLAYDARNRLIADPTVTDGTERMLSTELANELSALISKTKVNKRVSEITEAVHKDTVYISVVDRDRMSVSLIYSIFHGFGSGIASRKYGVLFQNRGAGFNLIKGHPNELKPGKRPMHTIIPGMLREGNGNAMPLGVMGGQYQPCGHIRVLSNLVDYGMDIQAALDGPRSFAEGDVLNVEPSYDPTVVQGLLDLGHDVNQTMPPIGGAQAILENSDGFLLGGSDPRKDGCAIGY